MFTETVSDKTISVVTSPLLQAINNHRQNGDSIRSKASISAKIWKAGGNNGQYQITGWKGQTMRVPLVKWIL